MSTAQRRAAIQAVLTATPQPTQLLKELAGLAHEDHIYSIMHQMVRNGQARYHGIQPYAGQDQCWWSL
jgi:hypothetical protein